MDIKKIRVFRNIHTKLFYPKTIKNEDGQFIVRNKSDETVIDTQYENQLRDYLKQFKKGTFIDVGAHIGKYTIKMARQGMDVVALEPSTENFNALKKNIDLNKLNVNAIQKGCWESDGRLRFNTDDFSSARNSFVLEREGKSYDVDVISLDTLIKELNLRDIKLVKIDAEGAEPNILKGAQWLLRSQSPVIVFEAWDNELGKPLLDECLGILDKYGYKVKKFMKLQSDYYIAAKG